MGDIRRAGLIPLQEFLLEVEPLIAAGEKPFGKLRVAFFDIFGRFPKDSRKKEEKG